MKSLVELSHIFPVADDRRLFVQVIWVLVVRLQQQADGWVSGAASHGTGGVSKFPLVSLQRKIFLVGSVKHKASWVALLQEILEQKITLKPCLLCRLWVPGS